MKALKILFAIKCIAIISYVALDLGWVEIGEFSLLGQAEKDTSTSEYHDPDGEKKVESSLIERLMTLPKLDPDKLKRSEVAELYSILSRKSDQVAEQVEILKRRKKALESIEGTIDQKLVALDSERQLFQESIQKEKKISKERIGIILKTYEKMAPKKAAAILEGMDKDMVVELMKTMPIKQTQKVLEAMNADKSREFSEYFARLGSMKEYEMLGEMQKSLREEFQQKCK